MFASCNEDAVDSLSDGCSQQSLANSHSRVVLFSTFLCPNCNTGMQKFFLLQIHPVGRSYQKVCSLYWSCKCRPTLFFKRHYYYQNHETTKMMFAATHERKCGFSVSRTPEILSQNSTVTVPRWTRLLSWDFSFLL